MEGTPKDFLTTGSLLEEYLIHYGMPRRSGRYPWGSGEHPYQSGRSFLAEVDRLSASGKSEKEIAEYFDMSTGDLRRQKHVAAAMKRSEDVAVAKAMRIDGLSTRQIAKEMGYKNESSIRALLNEDVEARKNASMSVADFLMKQIDEKGMIDVGSSTEYQLSDDLRVSRQKFEEALFILEVNGYPVYSGRVPQATNPGMFTTQKIACPPGTEHKEIYQYDKISNIGNDYISYDDGKTFKPSFAYPASMDSKRLKINYAEDGGIQKDGVIEIRRGLEDLSLGNSNYAQVRILVDNTHYLKGMAVYSDNLPKGVDVVFNTNKSKGTPPLGPKGDTVLKPIDTSNPNNPFGSTIKEKGGQYYYKTKDGKEHLGLINKRSDEGDWGDWKDKLPSQFLGKQSKELINQQLSLELVDRRSRFDEIKSLNNPTLKKHLLNEFASDCDSAAVHLKAAALPRQKYRVLLPLTSIKDTEVYAPQFKDGETVALVRFPHGGTFEIPILKVNNKNAEGKRVITPTASDAIGINSKVAERLSGADFDGDTVAVIPCNSRYSKTKITNKSPLKELVGFDPKVSYAERPGMKIMGKKLTQTQMGIVSNLITDMTLKNATDEELARAVKHSMVVIDANKHRLDYVRSAEENGISGLMRKYQKQVNPETGATKYGGASTLLSRAKSKVEIPKTRGSAKIAPDGSLIYTPANETYTVKKSNIPYKKDAAKKYESEVQSLKSKYEKAKQTNSNMSISDSEYRAIQSGALREGLLSAIIDRTTSSELKPRSPKDRPITIKEITKERTQSSTRMAETSDARTLISDYNTAKENIYANYANNLKQMAKDARKEMINTGNMKYDSDAAKFYSEEVKSLSSKLVKAKANQPKERQAQRIANARAEQMRKADEDLWDDKSLFAKIKQQELTKAREKVGASRSNSAIIPTEKEWKAIQSGAIHETTMRDMLKYMDIDDLIDHAMPKQIKGLRPAQISKIKAMANRGYTISEIADSLGVSVSTIQNYLK